MEILSGPQTGSEGSLIDDARQRGIPLTILPELVRQINPLKDAAALVKLRRFIRRGNFQIVHTHSSKAGVLARLAAHLEGVPVIVHTVHGWSFHDYMPPPTRRVYQLLERYLSRFSSALVVVSESDKTKGLAAGIGHIEKYRLIRSAIPFKDFDPSNYDCAEVRSELGLSADAVVIGCVGRFQPRRTRWTGSKPLEILPEAARRSNSCLSVMVRCVLKLKPRQPSRGSPTGWS